MELGKKIRQLRFKAGLTQEQLAEKLGIGAQSVSKWENQVAMPDITALPLLAEIFGVQIDDLFDLTNEQRLNRIENRLDMEEDLPQDVFLEYEEFLKTELGDEKHQKRATELIAYLYWHKMDAYARKVRRYARDAIRLSPGEKNCQWMLMKADGHARWDWNLRNHSGAIDFYREMVKEAPEEILPYEYLLDNLIADHRADEAEEVLRRLSRLETSKPVVNEVYRAHIALARFDEKTADSIMAELLRQHPEDSDCLFESAQYYLLKCDYEKAIDLYEKAFAFSKSQPRFIDELQSIAQIHEIRGEYRKAADTCDRIIDLLKNEWHMTEEVELRNVEEEKKRLLGKV
ncbi:MAG: helix-turn-helix domain-containing protein [Lachnospiraceae bacterium]|nr:helix-turn-helix domain-containing protein [Lachnospiraceae bacterium]MBQ7601817.1 helix-turn-helix domain-containing protein [Lachnospiraceae bacterium]